MINSPIKNETVDCAIVRAPTRTMTERNVDVFHPGHNNTNGIVSASTQKKLCFSNIVLTHEACYADSQIQIHASRTGTVV
jgi:hypothetical protein